jgi:GT2 family glycosyltransferase
MKTLETSIIIPVFNQLDYTKKCIDSILADPQRPPLELILVDNCSTDGTAEYLKQLEQDLSPSQNSGTNAERHRSHESKDDLRLIVITNERNLGVAPAWNQGLEAATTRELCVINNDILATPGWIQGMREGLALHQLALVCPYAIHGKLDYELLPRARTFVARNRKGFWKEYSFCAFFMPRSTYERIGKFDENFQVGGYEDTDYCYRLRQAGMKYGISGASFIHHFGSITLGEFKKLGDRHVGPNRSYFIKKWGEDPSRKNARLIPKLRRSLRRWKMRWDWM